MHASRVCFVSINAHSESALFWCMYFFIQPLQDALSAMIELCFLVMVVQLSSREMSNCVLNVTRDTMPTQGEQTMIVKILLPVLVSIVKPPSISCLWSVLRPVTMCASPSNHLMIQGMPTSGYFLIAWLLESVSASERIITACTKIQ